MTSILAHPEDVATLSRWAEHRYETDSIFKDKADRAAMMAKAACPVEISDECFKAMLIGAIVALYLEGATGSHAPIRHTEHDGFSSPNG